MSVQLEKDAFMPSELARAMASVDQTKCKMNCTNILVRLMRRMNLTASDGRHHQDNVVMMEKTYPGFEAGFKTLDQGIYLELPISDIKNTLG